MNPDGMLCGKTSDSSSQVNGAIVSVVCDESDRSCAAWRVGGLVAAAAATITAASQGKAA